MHAERKQFIPDCMNVSSIGGWGKRIKSLGKGCSFIYYSPRVCMGKLLPPHPDETLHTSYSCIVHFCH